MSPAVLSTRFITSPETWSHLQRSRRRSSSESSAPPHTQDGLYDCMFVEAHLYPVTLDVMVEAKTNSFGLYMAATQRI